MKGILATFILPDISFGLIVSIKMLDNVLVSLKALVAFEEGACDSIKKGPAATGKGKVKIKIFRLYCSLEIVH